MHLENLKFLTQNLANGHDPEKLFSPVNILDPFHNIHFMLCTQFLVIHPNSRLSIVFTARIMYVNPVCNF